MEVSEKTTKSVLVTGAANAVGREVARRLAAAGYTVTGTVATSAQAIQLRSDGVMPSYPDLTRAGEIRSALKAAQADVIVHAAPQAVNHVPHLKTDWTTARKLIEQGTPTLLTAAEAAGVTLIIFLSYAFAGDAAHSGHGNHDEEAADPAIVVVTRAAEQSVLHGSTPAVILRAGYTYGPHSPETIALRDAVKAGRPLALGDAHAVANWIHIDDLASAVEQAIDRRPEGAVLDVVDNKPASPTAFAAYLARSMNVGAAGSPPPLVARVLFGKDQLELLDRSVHADNASAKQTLGWTPQFPSYTEGIDQTLLVLRAEEPVR